MDDFFLRPEQRTRERLETPGGNVDYERFNTEIMKPLRSGEKLISYKPYSCREGKLKETVSVNAGRIVIVEGAYSCHPQIRNNYDFRIFFSISHEEQMKRIIKRNGEEAAKVFAERWIPMEETYFRAYNIAEEAELVF